MMNSEETLTLADVLEVEFIDWFPEEGRPCSMSAGLRLKDGRYCALYLHINEPPGQMQWLKTYALGEF